jgi:hypothetical protein
MAGVVHRSQCYVSSCSGANATFYCYNFWKLAIYKWQVNGSGWVDLIIALYTQELANLVITAITAEMDGYKYRARLQLDLLPVRKRRLWDID